MKWKRVAKEAVTRKKGLIASLLLLILLTALSYQKYWGNTWYLQDDYFTVDLGGTDSIWDASSKMISFLYEGQRRYQPVRLFLFSLATHLVPEAGLLLFSFHKPRGNGSAGQDTQGNL